jgi:O-antigen ligase
LYLANNLKTREQVYGIVGMLCCGIVIQWLVGSVQYFSGGTLGLKILGEGEQSFRTTAVGLEYLSRVGGTIGGANSLAMYLNFYLPVVFCLLFCDFKIRTKVCLSCVLLLGGITEILTLSRGGWVALAFAMGVAAFSIFNERLRSRVKSMLTLAIIALLALILILGSFQTVRKRLFSDDYGSAYGRIPQIKIALNIIKAHPFLGVGLNNYAAEMNKYDRTRENMSYKFTFPVHNGFLLIAAESGLPAMFAFAFFMLACIKKGLSFLRAKHSCLSLVGLGFFSGILTWLAHAQFKMDYAGINLSLWFSCGMLVALHSLVHTGTVKQIGWTSKPSS